MKVEAGSQERMVKATSAPPVGRILVVDSDSAFLTLLVQVLRADAMAFEPIAARSGEEALRILSSGALVDWLLIDLGLPGMDGLQLLLAARELRPDLQIMVVTADPTDDLHRAALESGATRFFAKPLDVDDLLATLAVSRPGALSYLGGDLDLVDLCRLGSACHPGGGLRIRHAEGWGVLVPREDRVVHAAAGEAAGEAAWEAIGEGGAWYFQSLSAVSAERSRESCDIPLAQADLDGGKAGGCFRGLTLRHLLEWIAHFRLSRTLTVTSRRSTGVLVFEEGRIRHAATAEREGGQAAAEILAWRDPRVEVIRSPAPVQGAVAQDDLRPLIDRFSQEVDGFLATCVVRRRDRAAFGGTSVEPRIDAAEAARTFAGVVESHFAAIDRLGLESSWGGTEDLLITLDNAYVLIRLLGTEHYHWLAVSGNANLALCRFLMRGHEAFFLGALAGDEAAAAGG
jgi:CheY-like chemotaxis protein